MSAAPQRILVIAGYAESILQFRGALLEMIQKTGMEVHVAAPGLETSHDMRATLEALGFEPHDIPLHRTGRNPLRDLGCLAGIWRTIRKVRPVLVLGYTIKPVIYGSLAAWLARVPRRYALITGLGYTFQDGGSGRLSSRLARFLYALALARTHKVIFQNRDDEQLFRRKRILDPSVPSLVVAGSGVDLRHYRASPVPDGPPRFLMICRLLASKGVREYVQAARHVRLRHPDVRFRLAGWFDEGPDAIRPDELAGWVDGGDVEFCGKLSDVRPAIAECTVYVLPSYREGMPRTVLEAMAAGRAIVTTDAPGCRATVVDGENGFLVPARSVDALAGAMLRFVDEPGLASRMGLRSRKIARDRFDVRKVNEAMLAGMEISDGKGRPARRG